MAVVVLVLATPGLAVGYANGLVAGVGGDQTGSAAKTPDQQKAIADANKEITRPLPNKPMNILLIGSDKTTLARRPRAARTRRCWCGSTPRPRASPCSRCRATCA